MVLQVEGRLVVKKQARSGNSNGIYTFWWGLATWALLVRARCDAEVRVSLLL